MTAAVIPERWSPDPHYAAAVLSSPRVSWSLVDLSPEDRAWTVAELKRAGMSAREIAERTGCGKRLVNDVRADARYELARMLIEEREAHAAELRAARAATLGLRADLARARASEARLRGQVDQLLDVRAAGPVPLLRCRHPDVKYNVYVHNGRRRCRQCRAVWQANRRKIAREQSQ